jgi:4-hydroxy-4-methyl-2-oxoglutarate aldolase
MEEKFRLSHAELMELKRWNTPTIYNGWEQITKFNHACDGFNLEEVSDFMPHMGPMVGYAVTVVIEPGNKQHPQTNPDGWIRYREYIASLPGPKIVVVQDLDKPNTYGAFWGEVNSNIHKALGCVGTITDGGIRDLDEMNNAGFKALARRLCVGHAHSWPVRWDCEVKVFGRKILPGQLIHADKHGFLVIPDEDQKGLLDAARFMDSNECKTVIPAGRSAHGKSFHSILNDFNQAASKFSAATTEKFHNKGEW